MASTTCNDTTGTVSTRMATLVAFCLTLLCLTNLAHGQEVSLEQVYADQIVPLHVAMKEANAQAVAEAESAWQAFLDERRAAIPALQEDLTSLRTQLSVYPAYLGDCWDYYFHGSLELSATELVIRERIGSVFFDEAMFTSRYQEIWSELARKVANNRDLFLSQLDVVVRTAELPVNAQINCGNLALNVETLEELSGRLSIEMFQAQLVGTTAQWAAAVSLRVIAAQTLDSSAKASAPVATFVCNFGGPAAKASVWVGLLAIEVGVSVYIDGLKYEAMEGYCNTFLEQVDVAVRYRGIPAHGAMSVFATAADAFNHATWRTVGKKLGAHDSASIR